jgi:UDP-3-O-[3-hydroxymyristoyl] glucosamine N-acyltransferase
VISKKLSFFTERLGGLLHGSPDLEISGLASLSKATADELSFLSHPRYISQLQSSRASCVVIAKSHEELAKLRGAYIVCDNPYVYWAKVTQLWAEQTKVKTQIHIHPTAVVDPSAEVDDTAIVGPLCVVEAGVRIGAGTLLKSSVTISRGCVIGNHCILHPGVVIGADGFGFASENEKWIKVEQLGAVVIGDHVEIGANTCIDRGAMEDTVIEEGVKLDNLIQIGHNVHIGKHTAIAGCAGVAGSAKIGAYCTIGGGAAVLGHLELADNVHISAFSLVSHSILKPGIYSGVFPIDDNSNWQKNAATLRQLFSLRERIKFLEKNNNS